MSTLTSEIGGEIRVRLTVAGNRVQAVACTSTRPEASARMFIGRTPGDVTARIGAVYSLCGRAQTIAALMAVEQAQGLTLPVAQLAARDILRLAEMLSQTAMRLCLGWPARLSLDPQPDLVRACLAAEQVLEHQLMGGPDWRLAGGSELTPDLAAAGDTVQGLAGAVNWLTGPGGLADALRDRLVAQQLLGFGDTAGKVPPEQGALMRNWDQPAVQRMRESLGAGLGARLVAGLCDLQLLPQFMGDLLGAVSATAAGASARGRDGTGTATVETARGTLTHKVTIADGLVSDYVIEAPTEANFLPGGPVEAGLLGADAGDRDRLQMAAELHVLAIDPCVAFTVELADA